MTDHQSKSRRQWTGAVRLPASVVLATALLASTASAQDRYRWCVDPTGTNANWTHCGEEDWACDGPVEPSIAAALLAAGQTPDAMPGVRPAEHVVCVGTPGTHVESVVVDNQDGNLGNRLTIRYRGSTPQNGCPESGGTEPMFEAVGNGLGQTDHLLAIVGLRTDFASCASGPRRLATVGATDFQVEDARLHGGSGPFVVADQPAPEIPFWLRNSKIEGLDGAVYIGDGRIHVDGSELEANTGPMGGPLIDLSGPKAEFLLNRGAMFGNVVDGGPLVRTDARIHVLRSLIAGNIVKDAPALLVSTPVDQSVTVRSTFDSSIVSRNRILSGGAVATAPIGPVPLTAPDLDEFCLPSGSDQRPYHDRPLPTGTGTPGDGAILLVSGQQLVPRGAVFVLKSYVVQNVLGAGGSVLRVEGAVSAFSAGLVHSTIDQAEGLLVDGGGSGSGARFVSARNLYWSPPTVQLSQPWERIEAAMDEIVGEASPWSQLAGSTTGILGPFADRIASIGPAPFRDPDAARLLPDCLQGSLVCPEFEFDCSDGLPEFCPLDAAAEYLLSETAVDSLAVPWPWEGALDLVDVFPGEGEVPGASGWRCEEHGFPWDLAVFGVEEVGDNDRFTTLVDCDNDDPDVVPALPERDGFTTPDCVAVEGGCYLCPEGSDPGDDDDDDDDSDDDDSADDDDDSDEATPTPEPGDDDDSYEIIEGCEGNGCGYAYSCDDASTVFGVAPLLLLLPLRRRRAG